VKPFSIDQTVSELNASDLDASARPLRVGLLLSNLGSPDSPSVPDVRKYLKQFLNDPYVIDLPKWVRKLLVDGLILNTRPKNSAEAYGKVWTAQGSPLLMHTRALTEKSKQALPFPVEFGMRYGTPSIESGVRKLIDQGINHIIFLPLYPQYSFAASETAIVEFERVLTLFKGRITGSAVENFHDHPSYILALTENLREAWAQHSPDLLLLSYHGIPKKQLVKTRNQKNYQEHCLRTSELIRENLGLSEKQVMTTFQSRLGPTEWIKPFTDKELVLMPAQGIKKIIVASPSFTADCLETLEEIEMRYKELFLENGGESFDYIPCMNSSDSFVSAIQEIVQPHL
jgi:ferrochelatase